MSAMRRFCRNCLGSSMYNIVAVCCAAVVVLPHHLAPSINTAPIPARCRRSIRPAIRGLYSFFVMIIRSCRQRQYFFVRVPKVGRVLFPMVAGFYSLSWMCLSPMLDASRSLCRLLGAVPRVSEGASRLHERECARGKQLYSFLGEMRADVRKIDVWGVVRGRSCSLRHAVRCAVSGSRNVTFSLIYV